MIRGGALVALVALALAGCGTTTTETPAPTGPAAASSTPAAASSSPAGVAFDACKLVDDAGVTAVFGAAAPEGKAKSYGAGFSECVWQGSGKLTLRVSLVPFANLAKDYADKLNKLGPVAELGTEAVAFPGVVGIGHATSGGATVGFKSGDNGVLVAVRTEAGQDKDLATATSIAKSIG